MISSSNWLLFSRLIEFDHWHLTLMSIKWIIQSETERYITWWIRSLKRFPLLELKSNIIPMIERIINNFNTGNEHRMHFFLFIRHIDLSKFFSLIPWKKSPTQSISPVVPKNYIELFHLPIDSFYLD
jgi:hypothetical protein